MLKASPFDQKGWFMVTRSEASMKGLAQFTAVQLSTTPQLDPNHQASASLPPNPTLQILTPRRFRV